MTDSECGKVVAVCLSPGVGTSKNVVEECELIAGRGIKGDGHIDSIRPVSLLMLEDIEAYNASHTNQAKPGDFAENIVTCAIDLLKARVGDRIIVGGAELEVCQIGKEVLPAHYSFHGDRLLPTRGVFCRVVSSGVIKAGNSVKIVV